MFSSHSALYRRAAPALQEHLLAAQSHLRVLLTEQTSLRRARQAIGESQWLAPASITSSLESSGKACRSSRLRQVSGSTPSRPNSSR